MVYKGTYRHLLWWSVEQKTCYTGNLRDSLNTPPTPSPVPNTHLTPVMCFPNASIWSGSTLLSQEQYMFYRFRERCINHSYYLSFRCKDKFSPVCPSLNRRISTSLLQLENIFYSHRLLWMLWRSQPFYAVPEWSCRADKLTLHCWDLASLLPISKLVSTWRL